MADGLGGLTAGATGWLLTYLAHSTLLIGLVWIAVRTRAFQPETKDLLWKAALFAGVATATGATLGDRLRPSDYELVSRVEERLLHAELAPLEGQATLDVLRWRAGVRAPGYVGVDAEVAAPSPACRAALRSPGGDTAGWLDRVAESCARSAGLDWYHYLLMTWLAGGLVGAVRLDWSRRALRRLRAGLEPAPAGVRAALQRIGGSAARVLVSTALEAPCVVDRRTIALPRRCADELTEGELQAVLAHEMAHVERHDVWWLTAAHSVCACLWLQPLNRIALAGLIESAELVCDDRAVALTRERLGLARSISRVAEWTQARTHLPASVVAMAGGDGRALSNRVRRILSERSSPRPQRRWHRLVGAMCLLVPLMLLPAVPGPSTLHAAVFVQEVNGIDGVRFGGVESPGERRLRILLSQDEGRLDSADGVIRIVSRRVERGTVEGGS